MKFGATLSRRSVPQWRTHDLDYDEIKQLIKIQTSTPEGCSRGFETNLLTVLDAELERVRITLSSTVLQLTDHRSMSLYVVKLGKLSGDCLLVSEPSKT